MFKARACRERYFSKKVVVGIGLSFLVNSSAYATLSVPSTQHLLKQTSSVGTTAAFAKPEIAAKNEEQERIFLLGLQIMENFGCSDYTEKGLQAFIQYLRGQDAFKDKPRSRIYFTPQEHARNLTGHFSLLNYTEKTDTPESKIRSSSKGYSEAFRALSRILNEDLYRSYGSNTDLKKIADDLDNPRSQYGSYFKKKIRDALNLLNSYSSVDHFNVGCRIQGVPEGRKKNKLQVIEKDASGKTTKVPLDEYVKRSTKKKSSLVDSTVKVSAPVKTLPKEEVRPAIDPTTNKPVKTPSHKEKKPETKTQPKPAPKEDAKPTSSNSEAIIAKYLTIPQSKLGSYLDPGWRSEYEDLIGALIVEENQGLLTNFHKFAPVCAKVYSFTTPAQKIWFLKKFFKALARVESDYNPRNETRESTSTKYRPKVKGLPEDVKGLAFIDHSCGLFQLSEEAALGGLDRCQEMDYVNDVRIGYPSTRVMIRRDKNTGIYHEYNGDTRRTILNPFRNTACALDIMESLLRRGSLYSATQHWAPLRTQAGFASSRAKLKAYLQAEIPGC